MSCPLRIQFPAAVYHVINRGAARQPTFVDDEDSQAFLDTGRGPLALADRNLCLLFNEEPLPSLSSNPEGEAVPGDAPC
jgi:hypothetical protein